VAEMNETGRNGAEVFCDLAAGFQLQDFCRGL
jgi:hypothetical protein